MTYSAEVWRKAEKYFPSVEQARREGTDIKVNVVGEVFLDTKLWGENRARYTGIHAFTSSGGIVANSGVNLTDSEWDMLVENFHLIKEMLGGKSVSVGAFKRPHDYSENVKVYVANWFLKDKVLSLPTSALEYYDQDSALKEARRREPEKGKHYEIKDGEPEIRVDSMFKSPPEDTSIMKAVLAVLVHSKIDALVRKNCEACKVNSPSQFDHCTSGGCLDQELDEVHVYFNDALKEVQLYEMISLFDATLKRLGLKPILAKQLAKGALAYIPEAELRSDPTIRDAKYIPLGILVRDVCKKMYPNYGGINIDLNVCC